MKTIAALGSFLMQPMSTSAASNMGALLQFGFKVPAASGCTATTPTVVHHEQPYSQAARREDFFGRRRTA